MIFLFLFFLIFIFTLFYFTILYWFCHTLTWIHHRCTCIPKHEPPSHLPPHNISLGHPHAPAPSMLYPASDTDWWFVSHMILYMFQCHSPKSSHPLPLPQSPKVRSIHLCLFCCLASRVIITIFLNSVYMCQYTVLVKKEMATHSSVLAWRIPGTAEPGGLPSMGSHRVGHNWSDLAAAADG